MPGWYIPKLSNAIIKGMERHFKDYQPDTEPKNITEVPGKLQKHNENTYKARYVFLPIEWDGDKPHIRWQKEWSL